MFHPRLASLLLAFALPLPALAITNIENERLNPLKEGFAGIAEINLDGKTGNTKVHHQKFAGKLTYKADQHVYMLLAKREYSRAFSQKDADSAFWHARYIYQWRPTWAYETYLQRQKDAFRLLESRSLVGAGARYTVPGLSEDFALSFGMGAYYTEEIYKLIPEKLNEDYARSANYMSFKYRLTQGSYISNVLYVQPRFSDPEDVYVMNDFALNTTIKGSLELSTYWNLSHDSEPVAAIKETDSSYGVSLTYRF